MKKIFNLLVFALAALSLQSCLHDDNEIFDVPAAERIQQTVEEVKKQLKSSPNGWHLQYYTGQNYSGGGYNVFLRFSDMYCDASADYTDAGKVVSSTWDVKKDQGPVLSIDSYNEVIHEMSNPSSSAIDGAQGDYEFVVQKMTDDTIYLKGKKWGNHMVMTRVADDVNWKNYLEQCQLVNDSIGRKYTTPQGSVLLVDYDNHRLGIESDGVGTAYCPTPSGIVFPEAYTIDGVPVNSISYNPITLVMQSEELGGNIAEQSITSVEWFLASRWFLTQDGAGSGAMTYFNLFKNAAMNLKGEKVGYFAIGEVSEDMWGALMNFGTNETGFTACALGMEYEVLGDNRITLTMDGSLAGSADYWNGQQIQQEIMNLISNKFSGRTWTLSVPSTESKRKPRKLMLKYNNSTYFYMSKDFVTYPFNPEDRVEE